MEHLKTSVVILAKFIKKKKKKSNIGKILNFI